MGFREIDPELEWERIAFEIGKKSLDSTWRAAPNGSYVSYVRMTEHLSWRDLKTLFEVVMDHLGKPVG